MAEGGTPPREYDYLLTMPLWSLSDEKIAELSKQMHDKKDDHDQLEGTHIHTIWERDLDAFLEALAKQEEKDEKDRLAHKGVKVEGKGARAKARKAAGPAKKAAEAGDAPKKTIKKVLGASQREGKGGSGAKVSDGSARKPKGSQKGKTNKDPVAKDIQKSSPPAERPPAELSLRERLAAKAGMQSSLDQLIGGSKNKQPARQNALYDKLNIGTGKAPSSSELAILKGSLGQRRRRGGFGGSDSDDDEDDYGGRNEMQLGQQSRGGLQRPRDVGQQRTVANAAKSSQAAGRGKAQRRMIEESDSEMDEGEVEGSSSEPDWEGQ